MKKTYITILVTALVTSFCWYAVTQFQQIANNVQLMSAIKMPVRMALDSIEADLLAGRTEVAKAKLATLKNQWQLACSANETWGAGLESIMGMFHSHPTGFEF